MPTIQDNSFREWFRQHKLVVLAVVTVVLVAFAWGLTRNKPAFPDWPDDKKYAAATQESRPTEPPAAVGGQTPAAPAIDARPLVPATAPTATTAPAKDGEDVASVNSLFDPESPVVDPRYKLPVRLSTTEVRQLMDDMESLTQLAELHDAFYGDYNNLYDLITDERVRDTLYARVRSQKGFKYAELPTRWGEFSEAGRYFAVQTLFTGYVKQRVDNMRTRIIGSKYTAGDVKFVAYAMSYYTGDTPALAASVAKAKQLCEWLINDDVLTGSSRIPTALDNVPDVKKAIAAIRAETAASAKNADSRPVAIEDHTPPGGFMNGDADAKKRASLAARRAAEVILTPAQEAKLREALETLSQASVGDIHFVAGKAPQRDANPDTNWMPDLAADAKERPLYRLAVERYKHRVAAMLEIQPLIDRRLRVVEEPDDLKIFRNGQVREKLRDMAGDANDYFGQFLSKTSDLVRTCDGKLTAHKPLTAGDIEDIQATANELSTQQKVLEGQHRSLDRVMQSLRTHTDTALVQAIAPSRAQFPQTFVPPQLKPNCIWVVDPFGRTPDEAFQVPESTPLSGKSLPAQSAKTP